MTAEDGDGATVTDTFNLVVANTNDAPTLANVIAAQNATEDAAFSFQSNANTQHPTPLPMWMQATRSATARS